MRRLDHVHLRLLNWARHRESEVRGTLGYPTSSVYCREYLGKASYRDARIPILECEAEETQRAVDAMGLEVPALKEVVVLTYLKCLSYSEAADVQGCAVATVANRLCRADAWLAAFSYFSKKEPRRLESACTF